MSRETDFPPPPDDDAADAVPAVAFFFPELGPGERRYLDHEAVLIADRRRLVMHLYRRHRTYKRVCEELKARGYSSSLATVSKDIKIVLDGWKRVAASDAQWHVADALERLGQRERAVEADLERSRRPAGGGDGSGGRTGAGVRERVEAGGAKLHALLQGYWDRRCKLLGLFRESETQAGQPAKLVAGIDPRGLV